MGGAQPCRRRKAAGWQAFPNPAEKAVLKVLQVL